MQSASGGNPLWWRYLAASLYSSVSRTHEVHIIFDFFPLTSSLLPLHCSLLPAPSSLKTRNLYLTSRRIAITCVKLPKAPLLPAPCSEVPISTVNFTFVRLLRSLLKNKLTPKVSINNQCGR
ncbi:hypothetical protein [Moorena producens]|uniref:hypothetical protein n=1 Tax=Moorena producens TaxID=1155739 RepID=UPI0011EA6A6D|nr:hypothetical protein [Moorena producens]